jgi:signal transduction histidine kinase
VTADPHPLFLSTGFAALCLQGLVFHAAPWIRGSLPALTSTTLTRLWLAAWVVAADCFLLARPWWERRGRPPARPLAVAGGALLVLLALDAALLASRHGADRYPLGFLVDAGPDLGRSGFAGSLLAAAAAGGLTIASAREWRRGTSGRLTALAFSTGAAGAALALPYPAQYQPVVKPADLAVPASAALAFVGMLVTQRIETSRMRRATDRAEQVLGGRAEIAHTIAHDIRGPVGTIRGLAQTAGQHYERLGDGERREFLRLIEGESERLLRVADQTSTALKVDAGTLTFSFRPEDLAEIVRDGIARVPLGEHPLTTELEPDVRVTADRARLAEAIAQVLANAVAFSPPEASIAVVARGDDGRAVVEVVDRGPGIPAERRERVFEKFPRWRPPGYEEVAGAGLGLFICRGIVREHGGDVVATDGPDGGTMLRITIPWEGGTG